MGQTRSLFVYFCPFFNKITNIAEWIRLHSSCRPGFESEALHQHFHQFIFDLCRAEKTKRGRDMPIFKNKYGSKFDYIKA